MSLARSLISAAGTASRKVGTYVNYPTGTNRAFRTPLSSFLTCALSTTPDNISDISDSHLTTMTTTTTTTKKKLTMKVGDDPTTVLPEISSVLQTSHSAELGTDASSDTQSESLKPMDRDKKMAYLEEMVKNKEGSFIS